MHCLIVSVDKLTSIFGKRISKSTDSIKIKMTLIISEGYVVV